MIFSQNFPWISALVKVALKVENIKLCHFEFIHSNEDAAFSCAIQNFKTAESYVFVSKEIAKNLILYFELKGVQGTVPQIVCPGGVNNVLALLPYRKISPFRFCYVGRLDTTLKYVQHLIPLVRKFDSFKIPYVFTVIGGGQYQNQLKTELSMNIDYCEIKMLGKCNHDLVLSELESNHCLVLTSKSEGSPMVVCEAMSRGVIPVVTVVGGIPDLIIDEIDGFLYPFGETDKAAERLYELAINQNFLTSIASSALQKASDKFLWDKSITSLEELIKRPNPTNSVQNYSRSMSCNGLLENPWVPNFITSSLRKFNRRLRPLPSDVARD
ncbi:MAG: glycosyltransferase [Lentisphaeria bacterium]|nr:glycosyltransferase [Lentisphaeria bacterium]